MAVTTTKLESSRGFALIENGAAAVNSAGSNVSLFATTIKGGSMGTNKIARFEISLHLTTPALNTSTLTLVLKFGTASITLSSTTVLASSVADKPIIITGRIANMNATNIQYAWCRVDNNSSGVNILSLLGASNVIADNSWAIDTTVDQVLTLTATLASFSAGTSVTAKLIDLNLS